MIKTVSVGFFLRLSFMATNKKKRTAEYERYTISISLNFLGFECQNWIVCDKIGIFYFIIRQSDTHSRLALVN